MLAQFKQHPASVNESYFQHMKTALSFFVRFSYGAYAALVHAFFPFLFETAGSKLIAELQEKMVANRRKTKH
ncbi:MAG: DUF6356 family protein [Pseudomonadales bacterium]